MDMATLPGADYVSDATEGLQDRTVYSGVVGVVAANVIGASLVLIPFYKLGRVVGNVARLGLTMGLGGYLSVKARQESDENRRYGMSVAGVVLVAYGLGQSLALLGIPGLRSIGSLMLGPDASAAESFSAEVLAQNGSGRAIGQEGIYPDGTAYSFSDIKNAEETNGELVDADEGTSIPSGVGTDEPFVSATLSMMHRGMDDEPMYSHTVPSPLGHGVNFNLGAESVTQYEESDFGIAPSGGVDQDFGGVPQPSTVSNPVEQEVGQYINAVDVGGAYAEGLTGLNAFVGSRYPSVASTQPPVSYGAEGQEMAIPGTAILPDQGSVYDEFGVYLKPMTSAEADPMLSFSMPSAGGSGRGVTFWTAEGTKTGTMGRQVINAEGHGKVMGQLS